MRKNNNNNNNNNNNKLRRSILIKTFILHILIETELYKV